MSMAIKSVPEHEIMSSDYFEKLNTDPVFAWRVSPFPAMGQDVEILVRLELIRTSHRRRIVVLESGSGVILARLADMYPNYEIIGIEALNEMVDDTNNALKHLGLKARSIQGNPVAPVFEPDDVLITCMSITDQEKLLKYLIANNFEGDLLTYRFNAPGPSPIQVYKNGMHPWYHFKFGTAMQIANWKSPRLVVFLGTDRYVTVHTTLYGNIDVSSITINIDPSIREWVDIKLGDDRIISGREISAEVITYSKGPHMRKVISGKIQLIGNEQHSPAELEVIVAAIPMVEPGAIRWDWDNIPKDLLEKSLMELTVHQITDWISRGVSPDYH